MIVTFEDGTVAKGATAIKGHCRARGLDWDYWRRRSVKGLACAKVKRTVCLPDDWRTRLDGIFGADAVLEFVKAVPAQWPAIVVTPNATDTAWGQALGRAADVMFLVRGRINYADVVTGLQMKGNPKGTVIWLFADNPADVARFAEVLRPFGALLR